MIIFLYGKDTYRSRKQLQEMKQKFTKDRDPQGLNTIHLDAMKAKPHELLEQLLAAPFLAEKRMVIIDYVLSCKEKSFQEKILEKIKDKSLPEDTVLILWENTDKWKTKLGKSLFLELKKEKFTQEFAILSAGKLLSWIIGEINSRGGKIDNKAAQYISLQIKEDMWHLNALLDQLVSYKNGEEINIDDVQKFLGARADDNIFNLVDAVVAKKIDKAMQMLEEQYKIGKDSHYVFAMLLRQYRILIQIKDALERFSGLSGSELAKQMGLHPFVVKKSLPQANKYSLNELKRINKYLLQIDTYTKTGGLPQKDQLEIFIGKLACTK